MSLPPPSWLRRTAFPCGLPADGKTAQLIHADLSSPGPEPSFHRLSDGTPGGRHAGEVDEWTSIAEGSFNTWEMVACTLDLRLPTWLLGGGGHRAEPGSIMHIEEPPPPPSAAPGALPPPPPMQLEDPRHRWGCAVRLSAKSSGAFTYSHTINGQTPAPGAAIARIEQVDTHPQFTVRLRISWHAVRSISADSSRIAGVLKPDDPEILAGYEHEDASCFAGWRLHINGAAFNFVRWESDSFYDGTDGTPTNALLLLEHGLQWK